MNRRATAPPGNRLEALKGDLAFLELLALPADRNQDVARGFDGARRSVMLAQLSFIHRLGLLEAEELDRFSSGTRETIESLAKFE
jgi:hypothetical protein